MEREVASTVYLAVSLIAISIVISLVWTTIFIGNGLKVDAADKAVALQSNLEVGQLKSLAAESDSTIMPKPSLYLIASEEFRGIIELTIDEQVSAGIYQTSTYKINSSGKWTRDGINKAEPSYYFPFEIIENSGLTGKVSVSVTEVSKQQYSVEAHKTNID